MDKELIHYIVTYYSRLLTTREKLGLKHLHSEIKIGYSDDNETRKKIDHKTDLYKKIGWMTEDKEILKLIEGGQEGFYKKIAERILEDHKGR